MGLLRWCVRTLFYIFNVVLFLSGAVLLGVGIWLAVDTSGHTVSNTTLPSTVGIWVAAVTIVIVVGALVFLVGFLGCCGIKKKSTCLLCLYIIVVVVCIAAEITLAVLAIVSNNQFLDEQSTSQNNVHNNYTNPNDTTSAQSATDPISYNWNVMQTEWQCCGSEGYSDYQYSTFSNTTGLVVPYECCTRVPGTAKNNMDFSNVQNYTACQLEAAGVVANPEYLYNEGCYVKFKNWIQTNSVILEAVGFTFAGLQLLGLIIAHCARNHMKVSPA